MAAGIRLGGAATEDIEMESPLRAKVARFAEVTLPVWRAATFGRAAGMTKALAEAEQSSAAMVATADLILEKEATGDAPAPVVFAE